MVTVEDEEQRVRKVANGRGFELKRAGPHDAGIAYTLVRITATGAPSTKDGDTFPYRSLADAELAAARLTQADAGPS